MWQQDADTREWIRVEDTLDKGSFDLLRQEIEQTRLYQVCVSGAAFHTTGKLDNLYDVLLYTQSNNWLVSSPGSAYSLTYTVDNPIQITPGTLDAYRKYTRDYGFTVKTKFTPAKAMSDRLANQSYVDVATTDALSGIGAAQPGLTIDGQVLRAGHRVLVKDQRRFVLLSNDTDPSGYFTSSWSVASAGATSTTYSVPTSENGVYLYAADYRLVRDPSSPSYDSLYNLSLTVKLGLTNSQRHFGLDRLPGGFYPDYAAGEATSFTESKNWMLRHRVDYNNVYELVYRDILKLSGQTFSMGGHTYSVPTRTLSVGEFGAIYLNQSGKSTLLPNKYKETLNSISEAPAHYWICGNRGHLLKVSKLDFSIEKIELREVRDLRSIDWADDRRAIVVGRFNCMYETQDGGRTWQSIGRDEFSDLSYTKVVYHNETTAFVGGEAGTFIELKRESNSWVMYKRMVVKDLDTTEPTEDYLLVDDIRDMVVATFSQDTWPLNYSFLTQSSVGDTKEVLFIAGNNNTIAVRDLNGFDPLYEFKFLSFTQSPIDIASVAPISGSSSIYVAADKVYRLTMESFNMLGSQSNLVSSFATPSIVHDVYANKLFNFESRHLMVCGNESVLKYTGMTAAIFDIDPSFDNAYKSRMLFLNYDIASKLNFFDDTETYRLPNSVGLTAGELNQAWLTVSSRDGEQGWLDYYKDFEKTFEYYTSLDSSNQVLFSTAFTYSANSYYSLTASKVTGLLADILPLAPNIGSATSPMIVASSSAIQPPSAGKEIYVYRNLLIFRRPAGAGYLVDPGDVMYISCDVVNARLVVNKIEDGGLFGAYKYMYCYHNMEQGVVNDLLAYTGTIHVVNLNKYITVGEIDAKQIAYDDTPFLYPWNYNNDINPEDYFAYAPLANPNLFGDLLFNFNMHPVSYGYRLGETDVKYEYVLEPRFNNRTAYYNMQSRIDTRYSTKLMEYKDTFLNFGYKPHYNLVDYLGNVDAVAFTSSKVFHAMPVYSGLPSAYTLGGFTYSSVYFDTNPYGSTGIDGKFYPAWPKNKLLFGDGLRFEWETIWKDTFVDVTIAGAGGTSERMFVMDKYRDEEIGGYAIEFHKELSYTPYASISSIGISSRRTLQQVSGDLQALNNIHRSSTQRELSIPGHEFDSFTNLQNELNFRFVTDSYAKVLLSDKDIRDNITAMVFTDDKNELSLSVINLDRVLDVGVTATSGYLLDSVVRLRVTTVGRHGLLAGDPVSLVFTGSTYSSATYNRSYFGTQFVLLVIDDQNFVTDKQHGVNIVGPDPGTATYISRDPYLNFQPVDLMEVGVDSVQKRAVMVSPQNFALLGYTYSISGLDMARYRYELVDGLSLTQFYDRFPWALEGNISDALIGSNGNGLVWYRGDWECGRWFGGTWMSGRWLSGDWYDGTWNSVVVGGTRLAPVAEERSVDDAHSTWFGGRWFGGTWNGGTWHNGRMYSVDWRRGIWNGGIWNDGTWRSGLFRGGVWVSGDWESGRFNSDSRPSYWIGGRWKSGDFENGIWYDGDFSSDMGLSRFGTGAFNTRTAIWHGGTFRNSEFHSYLNADVDGTPIQSEYYKYSQWNAGVFSGGSWYGGVAYAINFNSGNWYGGVVEDIQVIGLDVFTQSSTGWGTKITLNGVFYINVNDEIWVINADPTPFDFFGSKDNPKKYYATNVLQIGDTTEVYLDRDLRAEVRLIQDSAGLPITGLTSATSTDTGLRVVANFRESNWRSGVWTTGIFESGFFEGGIWYGGRFNANWGR